MRVCQARHEEIGSRNSGVGVGGLLGDIVKLRSRVWRYVWFLRGIQRI